MTPQCGGLTPLSYEPSSDGFPAGFIDQRFERWVSVGTKIISALQRAYNQPL